MATIFWLFYLLSNIWHTSTLIRKVQSKHIVYIYNVWLLFGIALGRAWLKTSNIFVFYCLPNYNKLLCSLTHFISIYNLQRIQYKRQTNIACITISTAFIHKPDFNGVMWGTAIKSHMKMALARRGRLVGLARTMAMAVLVSCCQKNVPIFFPLPQKLLSWWLGKPQNRNPNGTQKCITKPIVWLLEICCAVLIIWEQHSRAQKMWKDLLFTWVQNALSLSSRKLFLR